MFAILDGATSVKRFVARALAVHGLAAGCASHSTQPAVSRLPSHDNDDTHASATENALTPRDLRYEQGKSLLAVDPRVPPHRVELPRHHWKYTHEFRVVVRICVAPSGLLRSADVTDTSQPQITDAVLRAVSTWRYNPLRIDGVRMPFCYDQPIVIKR